MKVKPLFFSVALLSFNLFSMLIFPHQILASDPPPNAMNLPADFPEIIDNGGLGAGKALTGFGGGVGLNQAQNRERLNHVPVILIHGNGAHATHKEWGVLPLYRQLKDHGYNDAEIWSVSYLGKGNGDQGGFSGVQMNDPYKTNMDDIRNFINCVIEYLGVSQIDIIGHSLGGLFAKGYVLGLDKKGTWGGTTAFPQNVRTLVSLAAGHYGLGAFSMGEFKSGSNFEKNSHYVEGIFDDTPYGPVITDQQGKYQEESSLDNGSIVYIAIIANNDAIDRQNPGTGKLKGANINISFNLGASVTGHKNILSDERVFDVFLPFLLKSTSVSENPPVVSINPPAGTFCHEVTVSINATQAAQAIFYKINQGPFYQYSGAFVLQEDAVIEAYATNAFGVSETTASEFKRAEEIAFEESNATILAHAQAKRISWGTYADLIRKYGSALAKITLFRASDKDPWLDVAPGCKAR